MIRKSIVIPLLFILLFILLYSQRGPLVMALMEKNLPSVLASNTIDELDEGLHIAVCGAGGPMPDPKRSGACLLVIAGDNLLMIDAGSGGARNINRMGMNIGDVDAVLLTHFHSDHIDGLGEVATLRWASNANTSPLPVIAPTGVARIVDGFNLAYSFDHRYRHEHHGDTVAPLSGRGMIANPFTPPPEGDGMMVWNQHGLTVTAFKVSHNPVEPAVGYRFDYLGRSIVISGDTKRSANLEAFAQGADLLLHEALNKEMVAMMHRAAQQIDNPVIAKVMDDIHDYHTSPTEAAASAQAAGVGHLALYHIVPPVIFPGQDKAFLAGVDDHFDGPTTLTENGVLFSLPTNSTAVLVKRSL
ncbi:Ribonuclease BN [Sinobacterium norvegicum]|uniref:Ribonuclease BN n=1 Tax=Sinobacterium norvegicum TaxID=1641715 RepID=A0ABM9ABT7_9GAMM|nr:MBL fold metallo-hydrolase [Sinobacterium norvegicum]CAH0990670.1 Ribonuclease BN [Sinobacterium norvegicum]